MPNRRRIALLAAAMLTVGGAIAAVALGGDGQTRQEAVAKRGARVMPFSLDATTHVFDATATGGTQRVVADDPNDREQIRLIRRHLRKEAEAFRRGEFADPETIHGRRMPGLAALTAGYQRIEVSYRDLPDGGRIDYRTADPSLAAAIRDWFDAQLSDHGDHAQPAANAGPDSPTHRGHED
jgi:hypothetical protein